MDTSQKNHEEFWALPGVVRQKAYERVRARVGPSAQVTVSEMLFVAKEMM